jgi:hypothetical protein
MSNIEIQKAAEDLKAIYLPKYTDTYPKEWAQFINFLDHSYKQAEPVQTDEQKQAFMSGGRVRKGGIQIWGYMTMLPEHPLTKTDIFPELETIRDKVEEDYGRKTRSSFALLNFSNAENITGRHHDKTHNMYIQCIGSVTWKIYDDLTAESGYTEYVLNPGDAIWVPSGISHEVEAHCPRTAITLAFEPHEPRYTAV